MTDDSNCMIRKATQSDIQGIIALLYQADAVHHGIRPDLFKGNTPKYDEQELAAIIDDAAMCFYQRMGMKVQKTTMEVLI